MKAKAGDIKTICADALIEISQGDRVKYEWDEKVHRLRVDRFLYSAVYLPFNYGFLLDTKQTDGDPADVIVYSSSPIVTGAVIKVKIIGLLRMEDEAGEDNKFVVVPGKKIDPQWSDIDSIDQLSDAVKKQTISFFEHYKQLEPKKWAKVKGFYNSEKAVREWEKVSKTS